MIEVTSGDVLAMQDAAFADLLAEMNSKHRQIRLSALFAWIAAAIVVLVLMAPAPL